MCSAVVTFQSCPTLFETKVDQQLQDLGEPESSPRVDKFCVQTVEAESELSGKIGALRDGDATANPRR
jgi:hypothetical protein